MCVGVLQMTLYYCLVLRTLKRSLQRRNRIAKTNKKCCLCLIEARVQRLLFKGNIVFSTCVPILPQVESPRNRWFNWE